MITDILFYLLPSPVYWVMVVLWGLSLGSFTTCVLYRVPRGISLWRQQDGSYRSFCPSCGHALRGVDLVPVFSWLWQKGCCRYCKVPIGFYYPVVELLVLACVLIIGWLCQGRLYFFIISMVVPLVAGLGAFLKIKISR